MSLPVTGERTVPGLPHENYWFRRHEAAYVALAPRCANARVLEAGCGEGYGAGDAQAAGATAVVALDYDAVAVAHARRRYGVPTVQGNLVDLPFADGAFDMVLGLQTIEHLWDQPQFVAECARVLLPGGLLALTTPNRLTFPPGNAFHARELDPAELGALVEGGAFRVESMWGLRHGERIVAHERRHGDIVAAQLASEPERWPDHLSTFVAGLTAADFVTDPDDIDSGLDLCLVAVRI